MTHCTHKRGLLPRRSSPGTLGDVPCSIENIELTDAELLRPCPRLQDHVYHVFSQRYSSCAAESATSGLALVNAIAGLPKVIYNPLSVYVFVNGGRDAGSRLDENLRRLQTHGVLREEDFPYSRGLVKPPAELFEGADKLGEVYEIYHSSTSRRVRRAKSAVHLGYPVVAGSKGHAVLIVYDDGSNYPLVLNTWDTTWGDNGFGKWDTWEALTGTYGAWAYRTPGT